MEIHYNKDIVLKYIQQTDKVAKEITSIEIDEYNGINDLTLLKCYVEFENNFRSVVFVDYIKYKIFDETLPF
jgi:hypothetical protein